MLWNSMQESSHHPTLGLWIVLPIPSCLTSITGYLFSYVIPQTYFCPLPYINQKTVLRWREETGHCCFTAFISCPNFENNLKKGQGQWHRETINSVPWGLRYHLCARAKSSARWLETEHMQVKSCQKTCPHHFVSLHRMPHFWGGGNIILIFAFRYISLWSDLCLRKQAFSSSQLCFLRVTLHAEGSRFISLSQS